MKSIVKVLEEKNVSVALEYFGINDLATSLDVNDIIDKHSYIIQYFSDNHNLTLDNIDYFLDYCYADKILKMKEIIPLINTEENKRLFSNVINIIEIYLDNIPIEKVIKFINQNYPELFNEKYRDYGLTHITLDFIMKYQSGINKDVYKFLIREYDYLILDNYDKFLKKIEKDNELFSELFEIEKVLNLFSIRQDIIQDIFISIINRNKSSLIMKVNNIIENLIVKEEIVVKDINDGNIMQYELEIKSFHRFLKKIKHQKANDFSSYVYELQIKMNSYLLENGQHISYEMPIEEILDKLRSEEKWELKLLMLTHTNINSIIQSSLNMPSEGKKGLVDYVSTNFETDDHYTRSHIRKLDLLQTIGSATWLGIIKDNYLFHESLNWFLGYIHFIFEKIGYEEFELSNDLILLYQMLDNSRNINQDKDSQLEASLCYGVCMFICSFIEKVLRIVYSELKRELEYVPVEKITLGDLLNDKNSLYKEIFGEYQLKHLRYFLLTDGDKKIGRNYRNSLAHYYSIKAENINMFLAGKLMFIFTNIITSFFVYFFMNDMDTNKK